MNIIVTGASKGIGKEICLKSSKDGENRILAIARNEKLLKQLAEEAEANNIRYIATDLNEELKSPESLKNKLKMHFDRIDILINNAGVLFNKPFTDLSVYEIEHMTYTHFLSPALIIRELFSMFVKGSHIVNISSMGGFQGSSKYPGMSVYSASKAAIANLTESLASEYSDRQIFFNCLALGAVQTEMLESAFPGYEAPVKADEMGEFIYWFAREGKRFFNGKILPVSVSNP